MLNVLLLMLSDEIGRIFSKGAPTYNVLRIGAESERQLDGARENLIEVV